MKKGDTVKLSAEGLRLFSRDRKGIRPQDRRGKVVSTGNESRKPLADGCVRVWWDHYAQPETVAATFLEVADPL
jgi:hypothetical protein